MSTPRFARGTKSRVFLYMGAVTMAGVVVYFFHGTQVERDNYQKKSEKCVQQQESLSAQLQVIIEYKVRLEKSLQQEKGDHRRTKEELQEKLEAEKQFREKQNLDNINKFSSLQQQYKLLKSQHEDLNDDCSRLRVTQLQGAEERSKLESALQGARTELERAQAAKKRDMESLKSQFLHLEAENENLAKRNKELAATREAHSGSLLHLEKENLQLKMELADVQHDLQRCVGGASSPQHHSAGPAPAGPAAAPVVASPAAAAPPQPSSSPVAVAPPNLRAQVLQEPDREPALDKVSPSGVHKSTTPQINPDAVLSRDRAANAVPAPPAQDAVESPAEEGVEHEERGQGPEPPPQQREQEQQEQQEQQAALPPPQWGQQQQQQQQQQPLQGPLLIPNQHAWGHQQLPAGVVPAPRGYGLHHDQNAVGGEGGGGAGADGWPWAQHQPWGGAEPAVPVAPGQQRRALDGPRRHQRPNPGPGHRGDGRDGAHEEGEEDREIPRHLHNPYEYGNAEEDKDRAGDLQLEEGEEEDDDDVDQIDYANEAGNNAEGRQKRGKEIVVNLNKHDSVMVNPK